MKVQEEKGEMGRVDLRDDKVDGHFFTRGGENRRLGRLLEEILARVLEIFGRCHRQESFRL